MYRKMYARLFNAVSDALQELDSQNLGIVKKLLMQAQIDCEEIYMQTEEETEEKTPLLGDSGQNR